MANKYLLREDAPFGVEIWSKLDEVVVAAARSQLSGRRLLDIEGPYGLGLKSVPLVDRVVVENGAKVMASDVLPVPMIETEFSLGARDLANFEQTGFSLDTGSIAQAAMAAAAAEDMMIFQGNDKLGIKGLLTTPGTQTVKLGNWEEIGTAANDVIKGVTALDAAGFHGPYILALAPGIYNLLHRLYPQGYQIELQHVESIVGSPVIKAPGITSGGVLIAAGKQFASIVMGQDLMTAFVGPDDSEFEFRITESLVPWIKVPGAVCVLKSA